MIVNYLHIDGSRCLLGPLKTHAPLVIDSDRVLAFPISFENFKTVAGQRCQILQGNGSFQAIKLQTCGPFDSRECLDSLSDREVFGSLIPVADDHQLIITGTYALRQA